MITYTVFHFENWKTLFSYSPNRKQNPYPIPTYLSTPTTTYPPTFTLITYICIYYDYIRYHLLSSLFSSYLSLLLNYGHTHLLTHLSIPMTTFINYYLSLSPLFTYISNYYYNCIHYYLFLLITIFYLLYFHLTYHRCWIMTCFRKS